MHNEALLYFLTSLVSCLLNALENFADQNCHFSPSITLLYYAKKYYKVLPIVNLNVLSIGKDFEKLDSDVCFWHSRASLFCR